MLMCVCAEFQPIRSRGDTKCLGLRKLQGTEVQFKGAPESILSGKMRFDGFSVWSIIASVSFRPSRPVFWCTAIAGLACLAFAWASRAGEEMRSIEVVPFNSMTMDTNFNNSSPDDLRTFKAWQPTAPNQYKAPPPRGSLPPPQRAQQPALTQDQQELLERRRNWVFMTPDDYASTDSKNEKDPLKSGSGNEKNLTAMERFYQRLTDSEKAAATNRLSRLNNDRTGQSDNSPADDSRNNDSSPFAAGPFNSNPDSGVFQSIPRNVFGSAFGDDSSVKTPTPEEVRMQAEQKARMDTYKQLWDINQTPATTPTVSTPASTPIDSAPLFGAAAPTISSSTFNPVKPVTPGNPVTRQQNMQPVAVPRVSAPPHSDFAAPQRPF
jgi:hypothetical protein